MTSNNKALQFARHEAFTLAILNNQSRCVLDYNVLLNEEAQAVYPKEMMNEDKQFAEGLVFQRLLFALERVHKPKK